MATAASHSEVLGLRPLGQEDCEVCRDSIPGNSSVDFLEGVRETCSDCTAAPGTLLGFALALHMAWGMSFHLSLSFLSALAECIV